MDKPISVGDLVQVVFPKECCGIDSHVGRIFIVASFRKAGGLACAFCEQRRPAEMLNALGEGMSKGYSVTRLKRIQPLGELDDVKRDEEITA
jgi:hypothetical protein